MRSFVVSRIASVVLAGLVPVLVAPGVGHAARKRRAVPARIEKVSQPTVRPSGTQVPPMPEPPESAVRQQLAQPPPRPAAPLALPGNPVVFIEGQSVPRGYLAIPSARTALRVAGFLKLDAIHDTGPYSGDASDLPNLSLRGDPAGAPPSGVTRLHARESRLSLGTFTDTAAGPVVTFLEVDFYGSAGASTYGLRMRNAYVSWNWLLAGQTYSNFLDTGARGTTIEFNGPTAAGNRKRAQVRLTGLLAPGVTMALAFENGAADYTGPDGKRVVGADSVLDLGSAVIQQLPDLTGQLRFQSEQGHVAVRGMTRQLRVLPPGGLAPAQVRYGYGLAVSGRWAYDGPSNVFAQATGGQGLGGYVDDLDGQAASFDGSGQRFFTQLGYAALLGIEPYLTERWRFNLIGSLSGVRLPGAAPAGPQVAPISTRFLQLHTNVLYEPTAGLLMGLEYAYFRRETSTPLTGWSHRFQMAILYRFGG